MEKLSAEANEKEFRNQQSEKIIYFLDRVGVYEYIQRLQIDPEKRTEISFEKFKDFLVRINGILRDVPIHERKPDGENVYLDGFDQSLVPKHEDKEVILKEAYDVISSLPGEEKNYLLPAVINAIHLFVDGNGRTSRVLYALLSSGSKEEFAKNLALATRDDGRYNSSDINPGLISVDIEKIVLTRHGIEFKNDGQYSPVFPAGYGLLFASTEEPVSPKAKEFMALRKIDQPYCFIAAHSYLKEKDILSKVLLKIPSGVTLSPLKMEKELTDDDWDEILKRYYRLKKEHVEVLINSFVEPDSYKNIAGSMNLKDYFIKRIQERLKNNQEG